MIAVAARPRRYIFERLKHAYPRPRLDMPLGWGTVRVALVAQ